MNKKVLNKANLVKVIVIIGVIIIPLMYSFFYLSAFWDPYSKLDNLPIAIVNNDAGAIINNEQRNLGNEFFEELEKDGSFKYSVTNEEEAKQGTETSEYYAMIEVPENFSADIASAGDINKQTANIVFSPNEKRNYLASQILGRAELEMETSLREKISGEIVKNLTGQVAEVPGQLGTLNDGLTQLSDGSSELVSGSQTLASGSQKLASGTQTLVSGTQTLASGSQTLASGTSEFASKFFDFNAGVSSLRSGSEQVNAGAQTLSSGTSQLNDGIQAYSAGVDQLIGNVNQTSAFIASFVQSHPELMNDPQFAGFIQNMASSDNAESIAQLESAGSQLSGASETIAAGATTLAAGTSALDNGIETVSSAAGQLNSAADSISSGASTLSDGVTTLSSGASTLSDGATSLSNGATTLANGQQQLNGGINTAQDGVITAVNDANTDVSKLDGLSDFVSAPVTVDNETIDPIANYGTYFSPYFMSLSLWVGALIIFFGIYFDADQKFKILSRESSNKTARSFIYLLLGFVQAILLGTIIKYALGLEIAHVELYFISVCLVSMVFLSIVQFCIVHMGDAGKFVALTLLILQLTSCGGTFPIETVPKFFQMLYPFMPMTYSIVLFKDTITGAISGDFWYSFMILTIYLVVFFAATILLSIVRKRKNEKATVTVKAELNSDQLV